MTVFFIGGCARGWNVNCTPVQRALWLSRTARTVTCLDIGQRVADALAPVVTYVSLNNWKSAEIDAQLAAHVTSLSSPPPKLFWAGPALPWVRAARRLARRHGGLLVVDLYDHSRLAALSSWLTRRWVRAAAHELRSFRFRSMMRTADLVIRAIHHDSPVRLADPDRRIDVLNGVVPELIATKWSPPPRPPDDPITFGYVGAFEPSRVRGLCSALIRAAELQLSLQVICVGEIHGSYAARVMAAIASKSDGVRLLLHGPAEWPNAMDILRQCDACLYPFSDEAHLRCVYPIKLGEYMALGKPIISSDLPGARAMIGDTGSALFVSPAVPDQWCAAMRDLMCSPDRRRAMGEAGLERARQICWDTQHARIQASLMRLVPS